MGQGGLLLLGNLSSPLADPVRRRAVIHVRTAVCLGTNLVRQQTENTVDVPARLVLIERRTIFANGVRACFAGVVAFASAAQFAARRRIARTRGRFLRLVLTPTVFVRRRFHRRLTFVIPRLLVIRRLAVVQSDFVRRLRNMLPAGIGHRRQIAGRGVWRIWLAWRARGVCGVVTASTFGRGAITVDVAGGVRRGAVLARRRRRRRRTLPSAVTVRLGSVTAPTHRRMSTAARTVTSPTL